VFFLFVFFSFFKKNEFGFSGKSSNNMTACGPNAQEAARLVAEEFYFPTDLDFRLRSDALVSADKKIIHRITPSNGNQLFTFVGVNVVNFRIPAEHAYDFTETAFSFEVTTTAGGAANLAVCRHIGSLFSLVTIKNANGLIIENINFSDVFVNIKAKLMFDPSYQGSTASALIGFGSRADRETRAATTTRYVWNMDLLGFFHHNRNIPTRFFGQPGNTAFEVEFHLRDPVTSKENAVSVKSYACSAGILKFTTLTPTKVNN